MNKYKFDCGCEIDMLDEKVKPEDGLPSLSIDYENLRLDCPLAWNIFAEGKTQGVWQLEKSLGQTWSKKIQPSAIEEVAALGALLRPGCLKSIMDGKSMTQHYADRKMGNEENIPLHPKLAGLLDETYNVLTYQEQSMAIAVELAKINEQQADTLRRAIGKKKADVMAKAKAEFIEGCKGAGIVNEEDAAMIFAAIEKSNRYAFNKSHAVEYGFISYWTAWAKAHVPFHFFCAYLNFAKEKIKPKEEIALLVDDAKLFNIPVFPPRLDTSNFTLSPNGIFFGLNNVKGVGQTQLEKMFNLVHTVKNYLGREPKEWTWFEFMTLLAENSTSTVINNLISVGVLMHTGMSRKEMLMEYNLWRKLTDREKAHIVENKHDNLLDALRDVINIANKTRKKTIEDCISTLEKPPFSIEDDIRWVVETEKNVLGVPITYSKLDGCKLAGGDTTCKDYLDGKSAKSMTLAVEVVRSTEYTIKNGSNKGQKMGYLTLRDNTGKIEAVAFSNIWDFLQDQCYEGATLLVTGYRGKNKDSFVLQKAKSI